MNFNDPVYIFLFLPVVVITYFIINRYSLYTVGRLWLVSASLLFYGYWNPKYIFLILISIIVNYIISKMLSNKAYTDIKEQRVNPRKVLLVAGILFNVSLLGYYKYTDFFIENINSATGLSISLQNYILPLAISFFTFQQIAYLVDVYKQKASESEFVKYCLFVTFFPQLIAGPIVHHKEMMPQFSNTNLASLNWNNISLGMFIFSVGLFKKVFIADSFAVWANAGHDSDTLLTFFEAWTTSLSYTFQLYYDFSGYSDMAIGAALMFNIHLPINFNSPYKAKNIQDFWQRWHITLSRWLKDYIYIPMGGSRKGTYRTYNNLLMTFLIGGLWHGAGWTFIIWGALHGLAMLIHRSWQKTGIRLMPFVSWAITFLFVNFAWVFFRANNLESAFNIFKGMIGVNGFYTEINIDGPNQNSWYWLLDAISSNRDHAILSITTIQFLVIFGLVAFWAKNSIQIAEEINVMKLKYSAFSALAFFYVLLANIQTKPQVFLYFNF